MSYTLIEKYNFFYYNCLLNYQFCLYKNSLPVVEICSLEISLSVGLDPTICRVWSITVWTFLKKTQTIKGGLNILKQRIVWWTQKDSHGVVIVALILSSNSYRDLL